jgi:arginyl-tRNA synthetase
MAVLSLIERLSAVVGEAFAAEDLSPTLGQVQVSDRPDLAQFQCNGALAAAKQAKKNPRAVGEAIAENLKQQPIFQDISLAGPGFINITLTDAYLEEIAGQIAGDAEHGAWAKDTPETIVMDYGGPNVAKPLHVGHLRTANIGESLKRLMRLAGDTVVGDIHLGDWGKQMGQLLMQVKREQPDLPYFDEGFTGPYPETSPVTLEDLARLYPLASAACKEDQARDEEARKATSELQAGRPGYRALWQHFITVSHAGLKREYDDLGVTFDLWKGEADAHPFIDPLVAQLKEKRLLEDSDGAQVIRVAREDDKKDVPPLIMISRDGSVLYGSTDLGTIMDRIQSINPDRILYVVDARQSQHFEQVFRAADKMGLFPEGKLEHHGFGTINGPDNKPYKTREGDALPLRVLLDRMKEGAVDRVQASLGDKGYSDAEMRDIAAKVGMAALKFADLSNPRMTNYIFDMDKFLSFEGKTGPYLLYAAVRIKSVLAKAGEAASCAAIKITEQAERDLILTLASFADAMRQAYDKRMPHILCDHAYALAQAFSKFYANCRISDEADQEVKNSRLVLVKTTGEQLNLVLGLLGIEAPERM